MESKPLKLVQEKADKIEKGKPAKFSLIFTEPVSVLYSVTLDGINLEPLKKNSKKTSSQTKETPYIKYELKLQLSTGEGKILPLLEECDHKGMKTFPLTFRSKEHT